MQKIAIYGGSFNPIHNGHLIVAEEIRQLFCLDRVVFVPAACPPHKSNETLIEARHRLNMVQLAIAGNPGFTISEMEIQRGGTSYTIDTLHAFHQQTDKPTQFYFIIGSDAFLELNTWRDAHELFHYTHFIVIERPGALITRAIAFLQSFHPVDYQILTAPLFSCASITAHNSGKVFFTQATLANISSSGIREEAASGKSLRYLVPDAVIDYIKTMGLYQ
ncbi:MAG: nicotinate-nucleotide adenylyltransferase [Candidatus Schekmanbacteria bacterium]|nr:nicotinate-nucleotide adenylyltransferase [Candidatus Schekmanbacteria bacterium]